MNNLLLSQKEAEQFVRLWERHTGAYVARYFGISRQRAHQIAEQLTAAGVPLKDRISEKALSKNLDIEKLKEIILWERENR